MADDRAWRVWRQIESHDYENSEKKIESDKSWATDRSRAGSKYRKACESVSPWYVVEVSEL